MGQSGSFLRGSQRSNSQSNELPTNLTSATSEGGRRRLRRRSSGEFAAENKKRPCSADNEGVNNSQSAESYSRANATTPLQEGGPTNASLEVPSEVSQNNVGAHANADQPSFSQQPAPSTHNSADRPPDARNESELVHRLARTLFMAAFVIASMSSPSMRHPRDTSDDESRTAFPETFGSSRRASEPAASSRNSWQRASQAASSENPHEVLEESENVETQNDQELGQPASEHNTTDLSLEMERRIMEVLRSRARSLEENDANDHEHQPMNPLQDPINAEQAHAIIASSDSNFLGFLNQLWNGDFNEQLLCALAGTTTFFRMFRFPRDAGGRFPVLIIRVTSVEEEGEGEGEEREEEEDREEGEAEEGNRNEAQNSSENSEINATTSQEHSSFNSPTGRHDDIPGSETEQTANLRSPGDHRSWRTHVIRGSYPEHHPILEATSLLTDHPTPEDMRLLDQFFVNYEPNLATQGDIDAVGGDSEITADSKLLSESCPICLERYVVGDHCRSLKCTHNFHQTCVDDWLLKSHNSCPLCRREGAPHAY